MAAPTVTGLSSASVALPGGGTTTVTGGPPKSTVVITGTGFSGITGVFFGGVAALSTVVNSTTSITAVVPTGISGTIDVTVVTSGGTSATSAASKYTVITPYLAGPLLANEIGVPGVGPGLIRMDDAVGGAGRRRGRIIMLSGLGGSSNGTLPITTAFGPNGPAWEGLLGDVRARLNADDWQTVQVPNIPQFQYAGVQAWLNDISAVSDGGARFLKKNLLFWDRLVDYCRINYGDMPTFLVGLSFGAWWGLQVALNRGPGNLSGHSIKGAYVHCPVNDFAKVSTIANALFQTENSAFYASMSLSTTALNTVTVPVRATWAWADVFITGGNGNGTITPAFGDPVDAISMVSAASVATGGSAATGQSTVHANSGGIQATSFKGRPTDILWVADSTSFTNPVSGLPSFYCPVSAGFAGVGVFTYSSVNPGAPGQLVGVNNHEPTLVTGTIATGATVDGRVVLGGSAPGLGLVTGQGSAGGHGWDDTNAGLTVDSDDCLQWFGLFHAAYPPQY